MSTFQQLVLVVVALGLVMLVLALAEIRRIPKVRKPLVALTKKAERALKAPVKVPLITEQLQAGLAVVALNALLTHQFNEHQRTKATGTTP